ncbi:phage tail protein [Rhodospirillum rubrum]|uniref:Phage Tail Collar n=1 Tax=Rhodospirillum rubrum (strain ATCC 11170 / ATH 1.1.1 / DSM 467 / LMG 4362 / NCIMB 8255 / S1) TaxID=269796 RepID=Q2RUE1_RHORT|nr:tail fiber protein [Rhodospirillum rubrum]ABC22254.1 Phage Tail Collar [Rhodospirillum rubrum ATCC 11170]AEO47971.1 phage tail Collar [Rhodospirillum rubrum F11]MBK5953820.1 phage tail protein [Rhodospirillum rubrum]QXG81896.1 tail fiber protein [Rhodospirillum rubrum]HAQ01072.1 phage tail protein [Rhodospirillum rubrum]
MADSFIGEIRIFGFNYAPVDWAFCAGQTVAIAQNQALAVVLGQAFGGDGRTTFGLPNLQGSVPIGAGSGPGLTPRPYAQQAGTDRVSLTLAQTPPHNHSITVASASGTLRTAGPNATAPLSFCSFVATKATPPKPQTTFTQTAPDGTLAPGALAPFVGGGDAHENRQPYLVLNYCISLAGTWPSKPD